MLKLKKNCAVCKEIQKNKKLLNRIYNTSYYVKGAEDSLLRIAGDYKGIFSYDSLKNHSKKHQFLNASDYTQKMMRLQAQKAEAQVIAKNLEQLKPLAVWDKVIETGMNDLEAGVIEMKTADLLKAAKDKSDYEFKKSDQQLAIMATIAHFASGENTENERTVDERKYVPANQSPETVDSWQDQSSDFYQSLAGGAAPQGPS